MEDQKTVEVKVTLPILEGFEYTVRISKHNSGEEWEDL